MKEVVVKIIHKTGFFVDTIAEVPDNLAEIIIGLNKMCDDGIFQFKPHLSVKRGIYRVSIDTNSVSKDIIKQVKDIAISKGCEVKENTCYSWLDIMDKKEDVGKYFE